MEGGSVDLAADGSASSAGPESGRGDVDSAEEGSAEKGSGPARTPGGDSSAGAGKDRAGKDGDAGSGTGPADGADPAAAPSVLVIHVAGAVVRPGVVRVPSGSRAGDAVDAAGGTATDADLAAVNLAALLQDGMMVVVPRIGESVGNPPPIADPDPGPGAGPGNGQGSGGTDGSGGAAGSSGALININSASLQELDSLPRVGPVIAQRIIDWRAEHGSFSRPEDLDAVPGIGETMLAALLPLITV